MTGATDLPHKYGDHCVVDPWTHIKVQGQEQLHKVALLPLYTQCALTYCAHKIN